MLSLRPINAADQPFLSCVYAASREREMAQLDWTPAENESFLQMQFEAQHNYYQEQFPQADFDIILLESQPIGRLYVDHRPDEIRIVDIALLPQHRDSGYGSTLLQEILTTAGRSDLPVRIHVERDNPALSLYHRLGFRRLSESGVYYLMELTPTGSEE